MFNHILVPTDGSELSDKAVAAAIELARATGAKITGYACIEPYPYAPMSEFVIDTADLFDERAQAAADAALAKLAAAATAAGIPCATDASRADAPYVGIIDAASRLGCDLILMSSHGRKGLAGVLLGSETQKVLTHSSVPVLVYR